MAWNGGHLKKMSVSWPDSFFFFLKRLHYEFKMVEYMQTWLLVMQLHTAHNVFHKECAIKVRDIWNIQHRTEDSTESGG
jgi:hypothetical protein